jgi:anti-sigma factor RsiW
MTDGIRNCRDFEEQLTPYVDGEMPADSRLAAESHVSGCPSCRDHAQAERTARDVVRDRREILRGVAPDALRSRCAAQAAPPAAMTRRLRRWVPLSLAATVLLAVATVFLFGLNQGVEALAAGLTLDHVKCFKVSAPVAGVDPHAAAVSWKSSQGWSLTVPENAPSEELRLVDVRRCMSADGRVAHLMYLWRGQPLSVYVLPRALGHDRKMDSMGHEMAIWSSHGRTYAVLATGHPEDFDHIVGYVKMHAE